LGNRHDIAFVVQNDADKSADFSQMLQIVANRYIGGALASRLEWNGTVGSEANPRRTAAK
jgi:hypothetical protein